MSETIESRYRERFASSAARFEKARGLFPDGVTHDLRRMSPFPLYFERSLGSRKWDIDGHEFVDCWSGHGSMLLGHSYPDVVRAVQEQAAKMTHAGGCHDLELEWGELVRRLVPCAERVRFTGSGTEATLMALRLARMHTGRPKFLKFANHFHGWHDSVITEGGATPGVPEDVVRNTVVVRPNDVDLLERTLAADPEIAAVILEPTGSSWGQVPIGGDFLRAVRELTSKFGQVLIFDEVITGFRLAPGGAQEYYDIKPDLTSLAKILAGGLPGGCLAGRADLMDQISTRPGRPKMKHPGTYNANPLSAAAGVAALKVVAGGEPCRRANEIGRTLRNRLNELFDSRGWPWIAYGSFSMLRMLPDYDGERPAGPEVGDDDGLVPYGGDFERIATPVEPRVVAAFKQSMLLNGVDMPVIGGWLNAAATDEDIERIVRATEATVADMTAEGLVGQAVAAR